MTALQMTFDIEGGVRRLILILGDQLTPGLGALADIDRSGIMCCWPR